MQLKPKLFIHDQPWYALPFQEIFDTTNNLESADVVLYTGGSDVSPSMYGEELGSHTYSDSQRDLKERKLYDLSLSKGKKFLGICRGAQFLCVMAGGKLVQHTTGHGGMRYHKTKTKDGQIIPMNTLHHQMMRPEKTKHDLVAWTLGLSSVYLDGDDKHIPNVLKEPEIVYFHDIKALGIQCHPEMMNPDQDQVPLDYFKTIIKEYLL